MSAKGEDAHYDLLNKLHAGGTALEQVADEALEGPRRRRAKDLDEGTRRAGPAGRPLYGVPVAVKDVIDVEGVATTAASRILADFVPETSATAVERLRAAAGAYGREHDAAREPLLPLIVEAVRARASVGEISDALRAEWGVYTEPARF